MSITEQATYELAERAEGLARVLDVTKKLAAEKDLDRLLRLIIEEACEALRCERASLFLYDEPARQLYTRLVTELEEINEIRVSENEGIVGLAARERRIVHVPEPYEHELFNPDFDRRTGFRTRNILAAPLVSWNDDKLLGVLQLLNKQDGLFTAVDEQLIGTFAAHAAIALWRATHYEREVRVQAQLEVARKVQAGFFPAEMPAVPGYELAGTSRPADETGGDYYDAFAVEHASDKNVGPTEGGAGASEGPARFAGDPTAGSPRLGLVVADVCGHGLGPSLLMAAVRAMLRGFAMRGAEPQCVVTDVSHAMYADLVRRHTFITLMYGTLDPTAHRFRFANAGHGPVALHVSVRGGRVQSLAEDDARGCPLGVLKETYRPCTPIALEPGDLLVLGSDGIVETRRGREQFGMHRLGELLVRLKERPLVEIIDEVVRATTEFHERRHPDDDLTLLLARRR